MAKSGEWVIKSGEAYLRKTPSYVDLYASKSIDTALSLDEAKGYELIDVQQVTMMMWRAGYKQVAYFKVPTN